jgi:two-component system cell cycle sensor histidine kinase/response regulator CckA
MVPEPSPASSSPPPTENPSASGGPSPGRSRARARSSTRELAARHAPLLRAEQVRLLYASSGIALVTTPVASVTLAIVGASHIPFWLVAGWLGCVLAVAAARAVLVRRFQRLPGEAVDVATWRRRFVAGAAGAGLGWGAAGVLFFSATSIPWQMFLALVLAGVGMASVPVPAPVMSAFLAFAVPTMLPVTARFLVQGEPIGPAMAALGALFGGGLVLSAWRMHRAIVRALVLAFENRDLVAELSVEVAERARAEAGARAARDELEQRVRERTEQLRRTQAFLNTIVEHIPNVLFVKEAASLRFAWFNRAAERLLGVRREELLGRNDHDLFPREQADLLAARDREVLDRGEAVEIPEEPVQTPHLGTRVLRTQKVPIFDEHGSPAYLMACSEDITERQRLEAELRQAQKLEALGRLAGGIAHDFNNLLTVIIGTTEAWMERTPADDPRRRDVERVRRAAERAASLTFQLLAFSRRQVLGSKVLDVNVIISQMADLLHRLIGEHVRLDICLAPVPGWVRVDPGQLEQVVMNLLLNARDALPGGGEIRVATGDADVGPGSGLAEDVAPGPYVTIEVRDNGAGMTADVMARAFEPFFTTKDVGKGTGLGLSTVYGIVRQSGGAIRVASAPGAGSAFTAYLPRVEAPEDAGTEGELDPGATGAQARVLLVEDDEIVRDFLREILEAAGCTVVSAADGHEALGIADADPAAVDIVVTDLVMPGMGGAELMARLSVRSPGLPVVYVSGYADHEAPDLSRPGAVFLRKPLSPGALARAVQEALRARR